MRDFNIEGVMGLIACAGIAAFFAIQLNAVKAADADSDTSDKMIYESSISNYHAEIMSITNSEDIAKLGSYYASPKSGTIITLDSFGGVFTCKPDVIDNKLTSFDICFDSEAFATLEDEDKRRAILEMTGEVDKWELSESSQNELDAVLDALFSQYKA